MKHRKERSTVGRHGFQHIPVTAHNSGNNVNQLLVPRITQRDSDRVRKHATKRMGRQCYEHVAQNLRALSSAVNGRLSSLSQNADGRAEHVFPRIALGLQR
eukprot:scaffold65029_cov32-Tisochrysis_lutea.AAC.3